MSSEQDYAQVSSPLRVMRYCLSAGKKSLALDESPFSLIVSYFKITCRLADIPLPNGELECQEVSSCNEFLCSVSLLNCLNA
jgi:hypothetical protein